MMTKVWKLVKALVSLAFAVVILITLLVGGAIIIDQAATIRSNQVVLEDAVGIIDALLAERTELRTAVKAGKIRQAVAEQEARLGKERLHQRFVEHRAELAKAQAQQVDTGWSLSELPKPVLPTWVKKPW